MRNLRFFGYHGVFDEENKLGQAFSVHLDLYIDLTDAGQTDDINSTVNYADVYQVVRAIVEGPAVKTLERLGHLMSERLLNEFSRLQTIRLEIVKPNAPIPGIFDEVSVVLSRGRVDSTS